MKLPLPLRSFRLNLGPKIAFAVGGVLLVTTTTLAMVAVSDVGRLGAFLESAHQDSFLPYQQAAEMDDAIRRIEVDVLGGIAATPAHRAVERAGADEQRRRLIAALSAYTSHRARATRLDVEALLDSYNAADSEAAKQLALRELHAAVPRIGALADTIWRLAAAGDTGAARAIYDDRAGPLLDRTADATSVLMRFELDESLHASRAGGAVVRHTARSMMLTFQVALVIAVVAILWLTTHITRPLRALVAGTRAAEDGDLSQPVPVTTSDEIGALGLSFNRMLRQLDQSRRDVVAARDRATRASDAKSDFLASMSHELRTPLGAIIGFTNVLRKNKRGNLLPADLQYLDRINAAGTHLLGLINEILDLAKLESGKLEIRNAPTDVGRLVGEVAQLLEEQATTKSVSLVIDVPATPVVAEVDAENLRRVLINLAGNAVKFTDTGSVTLRLAGATPDQRVRFDVVDTGIGIPLERLDAIFDPFVQASGDTARTHGGTGLGLSISRTLCIAMGCRLTVESTVGTGSTFTVELPTAA
jgi:signal transduction histidine kinase